MEDDFLALAPGPDAAALPLPGCVAAVDGLLRPAPALFLRVTAFLAAVDFFPAAAFLPVLALCFEAVDLRVEVFFLRVTVFLPAAGLRALAFAGRFAAAAFFLRPAFFPAAVPLRLADRFFAVVFRAPGLVLAAIAQSSSLRFYRTEHYTTETRTVKRVASVLSRR